MIGNDFEIGNELGLCSPYLMFEKGFYNIDTKSFTSLKLSQYTITPNGKIYYIQDGKLFEYSTETEQLIEYQYKAPIEFSGYNWTNKNTNDKLILFLYDTKAGPTQYPSDLYCLNLSE